jgi:uncharacterized membrane protein YphA (DoxX/SURF4 family)
MQGNIRASNIGIYVYAAGAICLGLVGLVSGDFAATWQHVAFTGSTRALLAYLTALIELAAGLGLLWPKTARAAALTLTAVYAVFTAVWIPTYIANIRNFDPLGNVFEEFSLVVAGAVLFASLTPSLSHRTPQFARLYALSAISFGVGHIFYWPGILNWIPAWLPPSQIFWEYVTTIGFFLAAIAIISGIMAPLASRLLAAEILSFEILVWIPKLIAGPHDHSNWAGNSISIALSGAAWVVSDSICRTAKHASIQTEPSLTHKVSS